MVVSTLAETHLFRINDSGHRISLQREDCESSGFITDKPTITFSNMHERVDGKYVDSRMVVQVVSDAVYLLQWETSLKTYIKGAELTVDSISPRGKPAEIVAAGVNGSQVALALSGGKIHVFFIANNDLTLKNLAE